MPIELNAGKQRERERSRLACARLGGTQQVCTLQERRDSLCLNRGRSLVASLLHRFQDLGSKPQVFERDERFVCRLDADIFRNVFHNAPSGP